MGEGLAVVARTVESVVATPDGWAPVRKEVMAFPVLRS